MSIFENTVMIQRKSSYAQLFVKYLLIVLTVIALLASLFLIPILIFPTILLGVGAYFAMFSAETEFEYTYIEGELAIDKIKAKRRRKKVAKIDMEELMIIAPKGSGELNSYYQNKDCKHVDASANEPDHKIYDAVYRHGSSMEILSFEPDQNILDKIRMKYPRKIIM